MAQGVDATLSGWGQYEQETCSVFRPERRRELVETVQNGDQPNYIARGLGRSYGDSAVNANGGVLLQQRLNRFTGFDPAHGVLECEAGVSLEEIIEAFVRRGYFLPVTPGTKFVTLGGALAADVHGKNHHCDGTIGRFVQSLDLLTAQGEVLTCSPQQNADVFWATIGGMGLTGIILSVRLRLMPIETAYINVDYGKARNLDQALEMFSGDDERYRYSVAWIDCLATNGDLGRSVLMRGNHADVSDLRSESLSRPLVLRPRRKKSMPIHFPNFVLNPYTVQAFNTFYYKRAPQGRRVVDLDSYFYPLDGVTHWNRMYGKRGFVQYQALFGLDNARRGLVEVIEAVSQSRQSSFLAVLKRTGPQGDGMLSFPKEGYTLALDLPNTGQRLTDLLRRLDEIVLKYDGRLYLAKDAAMTADTFAAMYPRLAEFKEVKSRIDPQCRFSSSQARRVGIVDI